MIQPRCAYPRLCLLCLVALITIAAGRPASLAAKDPPATAPADDDDKTKPVDWDGVIGKTVGTNGTLKDNVYTIVLPRKDLDMEDVDTMPVPAGAINSTFHFFRCSCGMLRVVGEMAVIDYEANDVLDTLRAGKMSIASMSPMFINERPRKILMIRFQGEAHGTAVAEPIKNALQWMGDERTQSIKPGDDSKGNAP